MKFWDFKRNPGSVRLMVDFGCAQGLGPESLLRGSGLIQSQLDDPNVELKPAQELQVISNLLSLLKDRTHLGIEMGLRYRLSTFGIWGYGLISSATGADAMAMAMRFQQLTFTFTKFTYYEEGETGVIAFSEPDLTEALSDFLVQRDMAAGAEIMHEVFGTDFSLSDFTLKAKSSMDRTPSRRPIERIFGVEPRFGAALNAICFDRSYLKRILPQANPITATMCVQMCTQLMEKRLTYSSISAVVQQHLISGETGPRDIGAVAALMNTSERTLRRRLNNEKVSFSELTMKARRGLAEAMLNETGKSLVEIAERVGYSDLSTFSQAFKRWTGMPPGAYRKSRMDGNRH